jgi:hypothetical protein
LNIGVTALPVEGPATQRDEQIEKLNENLHKQAVHIKRLIPENRLNIRLFPNFKENNELWWNF